MRYRVDARLLPPLLLLLIGAVGPARAQAAGSNEPRWRPEFVLGRNSGARDSDVIAEDFRFGLVRRVSRRLSLVGEGQAMRFHGLESGRRLENWGVGLSAALRWHLWESGRWGVIFEQGAGRLQGRDPFPAGGTRGNFTLHAELGMRARLRPGLELHGGLRYLHLSNGRGLVPGNPGFNGAGAYLGVVFAEEPLVSSNAGVERESLPKPRRSLLAVEVLGGEADEESLSDLWIVAGTRISPHWTAQVEGGTGRLAHSTTMGGGISLSRDSTRCSMTAAILRSDLAQLESYSYSLQWNWEFGPRTELVAVGSLRTRTLGPNRYAGALAVSAALAPSLTLLSGVQWEGADGESVDASGMGVMAGIEWSPGALGRAGVSFFAEDRLDGVSVAGVRFRPGGRRRGSTDHRRRGLRRMR